MTIGFEASAGLKHIVPIKGEKCLTYLLVGVSFTKLLHRNAIRLQGDAGHPG
jgi:hypothetical protein